MEINNSKTWAVTAVFAAAMGIVGGVTGQLITQPYFMETYFRLAGVSEIDYTKSQRSNLVISGPKKVVVEQNDKVYETAQSVKSSLVRLYPKKDNAAKSDLENFYQPKELYAQGLILSSDGWLITNATTTASADWSEFVVTTAKGEVYNIDKSIFDVVTGMTFLHIPAKDLPVKSFADMTNLQNGQLVLTLSTFGPNQLNSIIDMKYNPQLVESSDTFSQVMILDRSINANEAPVVFNLAGEVVAFVSPQNMVIPASQLRGAVSSILLRGKIERPTLGIDFVSAGRLVPVVGIKTGQPSEGAMVVKSRSGAEQKLGLKEGDVIIQIGSFALSNSVTLNQAVQAFRPGDKADLIFVRDGAQQNPVSVKFGTGK